MSGISSINVFSLATGMSCGSRGGRGSHGGRGGRGGRQTASVTPGPSVASRDSTPVVDGAYDDFSASDANGNIHWNPVAISALLSAMASRFMQLKNGTPAQQAGIWRDLVATMKTELELEPQTNDIVTFLSLVDTNKVKNKWNAMTRHYNNIHALRMRSTGVNGPPPSLDWEFYDDIHKILLPDPSINPEFVIQLMDYGATGASLVTEREDVNKASDASAPASPSAPAPASLPSPSPAPVSTQETVSRRTTGQNNLQFKRIAENVSRNLVSDLRTEHDEQHCKRKRDLLEFEDRQQMRRQLDRQQRHSHHAANAARLDRLIAIGEEIAAIARRRAENRRSYRANSEYSSYDEEIISVGEEGVVDEESIVDNEDAAGANVASDGTQE
ncbi:hypothetical protein BJV82DRAFT_673391 [Fennellomyces sp. T-0311]|nr:hypothetical protein BJV82DRAFT_673391 [Fennellomyces sp. T-0311]